MAVLLLVFAATIVSFGMGIDVRTWKWEMSARSAMAEDAAPAVPSMPIRIGVLAHKGTDICRNMWQPTMAYLNETLPGRHFDLVPLPFDDIETAVKNKSIDFLICNPAIYVDLEVKYGVTRIMTLRNLVGTQIVSEFGGVVFCRADRSDLKNLRDARGQRLAAADETSFGGWHMALREFRAAGIDPGRDCARLFFLDSHTAVVRAVLSGEADIGTVRTDTLERMAADGEIRMDAIRIIPVDAAPGTRTTFPYLLSTRLYPEWPFARLSDTTEDLAREVTVALLSMPVDSPAAKAAQSGGWGVCLNYTSVHDCLRDLRMPPYEHFGQMSWQDICREHWNWLAAITSLIIALLGALMLLHGRQLVVMKVSGQNRLLLSSVGEGICGVDIDGNTTFVNPAASTILGYKTEELIGKNLHALTHHTKPDGQPYPNHECPIYLACKDGTVHRGSDAFFYRKNGSAIPVSYSSRPIIDKGRIEGAVICFRNIAERRRAEDALRESEEKYRTVANFTYDWEYWMGPDRRFIYCSPSCERITGYRAEEFEKDPELLKHITHPDDRMQSTFHIDDFPGSGPESHEQEVRIITQFGEVRWIAHACCIVRGSDGKFLGRRASNRDITDKKRAEEKICSLSQLLIQSQEKERLLISCELHDCIAQNLSVLKINSDMIYNDPAMTSPELREKLAASTGLLMQTIAAVRNMAYDLRLPGLDEMGLVKALEIYCEEASEKGKLKVDFQSAGMTVIDTDKNTEIHIYRLIQEALSNIRKHADADHATIRLLGSSPNIILRIEDDGRGFDVKAQELKSAATKRMGILSMQERVNLLQGQMTIQSQPMKGTKIRIKIPV